EGSGGEVLLEVVLVHSVPLVEEGDIGTEHLDGDQVVHRHSRLREDGLEAVEYVSGFLGHIGRNLATVRIETDATGDVERIADKDGVTERRVDVAIRQVDMAFLGSLCSDGNLETQDEGQRH